MRYSPYCKHSILQSSRPLVNRSTPPSARLAALPDYPGAGLGSLAPRSPHPSHNLISPPAYPPDAYIRSNTRSRTHLSDKKPWSGAYQPEEVGNPGPSSRLQKRAPRNPPSVPTAGRRTLPRPSPRYLLSLSVSLSLSCHSCPPAQRGGRHSAARGRRQRRGKVSGRQRASLLRIDDVDSPVCRMLRRTAVGHWMNMVRRASWFRLCMLALGDVAYVCGMQLDTFGR